MTLSEEKKCQKCLDYPNEHKCFRCGNTYCGCDEGSYYCLIGPSEYTCTPCYENHIKNYNTNLIYKICHNLPEWIGGIIFTMVIGFVLFTFIKIIFETYAISQIIFCGVLIGIPTVYIIRKIAKCCKKIDKYHVKKHREFRKKRPNESNAEYKHRINHARWEIEIMKSGLD